MGIIVQARVQAVGLCYKAIGNYKRAEYWLLRGEQENGPDSSTTYNLANFYWRRNDIRKSYQYIKKLKRFLKKEPKGFFKTQWGKDILSFIDVAEQKYKQLDN
ncbi:MAG: hypothetical protein AB1721_02650 [Patescibacteria group bacterium]